MAQLKFSLDQASKIADQLSYSIPPGLIAAVVRDLKSNQILMLGFMNREAVIKTLTTGLVHYWSRSRNELWLKGGRSGNYQILNQIHLDCDSDAMLLDVEQLGAACHTGNFSCFYRKITLDGIEDRSSSGKP